MTVMSEEVVYVLGAVVPGLKFPYVNSYGATLEAQNTQVFNELIKKFLPRSLLAMVSSNIAVFIINELSIKINLKEVAVNTQQEKKSVFVTG